MNQPIAIITIAYSIGIVAGKLLGLPLWFILSAILIFSLVLFYAYLNKLKTSIFVLILFALTGVFSFQISGLLHPDELAPLIGKGFQTFHGYVADEPKYKDNGVSLKIKPDAVAGEFYVWINDPSFKVNYGDNIELRGQLSEGQSFANPLMLQGMRIYKLFPLYSELRPGNRANPLKKLAFGFS